VALSVPIGPTHGKDDPSLLAVRRDHHHGAALTGLQDPTIIPEARRDDRAQRRYSGLAGSPSTDRPGDHGAGLANARSTYSLTFEVDASTPFTLDGLLRAGRDVGGMSRVSLTRGMETLFSLRHDRLSNPDPLPFNTSGVLAAGEYRLLVESSVFLCCGGQVSPSSYEFELLAVPEPQSLLLLSAGLALIAGHRARHSGSPLRSTWRCSPHDGQQG
jgi:PEP-CTERM motif-containing protein